MLSSPRRIHAKRGEEHSQLVEETVADRASAIRRALKEAKAINGEFGLDGTEKIRWRDLAPLAQPQGVQVSAEDNAEMQATANERDNSSSTKRPN